MNKEFRLFLFFLLCYRLSYLDILDMCFGGFNLQNFNIIENYSLQKCKIYCASYLYSYLFTFLFTFLCLI